MQSRLSADSRRGCIAVAVSCLNPSALDLSGVHPGSDLRVPTMTEETCTRAYWSGFRRIGVYCRDAAMNGFVMMGSGVRIPLAAPIKSAT